MSTVGMYMWRQATGNLHSTLLLFLCLDRDFPDQVRSFKGCYVSHLKASPSEGQTAHGVLLAQS